MVPLTNPVSQQLAVEVAKRFQDRNLSDFNSLLIQKGRQEVIDLLLHSAASQSGTTLELTYVYRLNALNARPDRSSASAPGS